MPMDERTTRQRRLAEVGDAGQARISAARFSVPAGSAGWVAAEYLRRAGAEVESGEERTAFVHASAFRFDACRDVAEGAFLALGKLRATLRVP